MKLIRTAKEVCVHYYKIYPSFEKDLCSDWMVHHAEIHNLKDAIKKRDEVDKLEMENDSVTPHPEMMHHVDNIRIAQLAEQHTEIEKLRAERGYMARTIIKLLGLLMKTSSHINVDCPIKDKDLEYFKKIAEGE